MYYFCCRLRHSDENSRFFCRRHYDENSFIMLHFCHGRQKKNTARYKYNVKVGFGLSMVWEVVWGLFPDYPIRAYCFSYFRRSISSGWSSSAQTPYTSGGHGNLNFRRVVYFRILSEFHFRSSYYIRDSGGTSANPSS